MIHIYKYRITLEDQDDFVREIEIKSTQTFEDFNKILIECVGFDGSQLSSFYLCDSNWRKLKEITLLDMSEPSDNEHNNSLILMRNAKLKDYTDDPHQKILFIYDFLNMHTFQIELVKILTGDSKTTYPRCTKSLGSLPKNFQQSKAFVPDPENDEFNDSNEQFLDEAYDDEDDILDDFSDDNIDDGANDLGDGFEELKF